MVYIPALVLQHRYVRALSQHSSLIVLQPLREVVQVVLGILGSSATKIGLGELVLGIDELIELIHIEFLVAENG
jgi:hypothetical protein